MDHASHFFAKPGSSPGAPIRHLTCMNRPRIHGTHVRSRPCSPAPERLTVGAFIEAFIAPRGALCCDATIVAPPQPGFSKTSHLLNASIDRLTGLPRKFASFSLHRLFLGRGEGARSSADSSTFVDPAHRNDLGWFFTFSGISQVP